MVHDNWSFFTCWLQMSLWNSDTWFSTPAKNLQMPIHASLTACSAWIRTPRNYPRVTEVRWAALQLYWRHTMQNLADSKEEAVSSIRDNLVQRTIYGNYVMNMAIMNIANSSWEWIELFARGIRIAAEIIARLVVLLAEGEKYDATTERRAFLVGFAPPLSYLILTSSLLRPTNS